ncbi:epoxide hydrolase [Moniliophthora roreri MCA 2997]|uniref:Epoxide hydrolase n=2 Tax=Moniliophthora roreri TaxID=221103 RepID=V2Y7S8_MONRO|nr:epoxide hydrolase [Moniliophthora roreri MCA 2997]KAI3614563.1 epoxide hydrolase [Moniliophthora roreri]
MASFEIAVSDESLHLLKRKLELTRLPDEVDGAGWDYGAPLEDIRRLLSRWKDSYDWRKHENNLNNELPQFTRDIETEGHGVLNIHYVYKESEVPSAIPLLFVHGWPGNFLEVRKILPLLTAQAPGTPSFHVIGLSLPGYGFSEGTKKKGFDMSKYAEVGHKLMLSLGYTEYVTQGGDWGFTVTRTMAATYGGKHVKAWHTNSPFVFSPPEGVDPSKYTPEDRKRLEVTERFQKKEIGYFQEQSTQPQTLGYSLADSPVGLLAWIYEKLVKWTDEYSWDDDEVLTWVSIFWFSRSGPAASLRTYYEVAQTGGLEAISASPMPTIPAGYSFFPKETWVGPNSWYTDKHIVFMSSHDKGGHFAAHEKPDELVADLRKMFGKGGPAYGVVPGKDGYA